jgi:hypothetical protein
MRPRTRRDFLRSASSAGAAALAAPLLPAVLARAASATPPNLVFVLGEGARWDESSLAGNSVLKTPNIDRIGRELYDLDSDPAEMRNIHGDPGHEELGRRLAARLEELRRETGDHYAYKPTVLVGCQGGGEECSKR